MNAEILTFYDHTLPTYYECGICDCYHSALWDGDCRQNDARFFADELETRHGWNGWAEIDMDDVDDWRVEHAAWLRSQSA